VNSISNKVKFDITNNQGKANKSKPIETLEDPTVFDDPQTQRVEFGDNGEAVIKQEEQAEETKIETAKEASSKHQRPQDNYTRERKPGRLERRIWQQQYQYAYQSERALDKV
jgi:hypothetical protein